MSAKPAAEQLMNGHEPTTATEVLAELLRCQFRPYSDLCIPRCCLTGWEADLLVIRRSGWAEEVEIKVSASDFRTEWKKKAEKHEDLLAGNCTHVGYTSGMWGGGSTPRPCHDKTLPPESERIIRNGNIYVRDQPTLIRRFWFAMPATLAGKLLPEVPEHYGVFSVNSSARVLRPAPILKAARKITDAERIRALQSTYHRFWQMTFRAVRQGDTASLEIDP